MSVYSRVLAIYPSQTGYGFVVLERRYGLVDWGEAELRTRASAEFGARVDRHIRRWQPDILAVEDPMDSQRSTRTRERLAIAVQCAERCGIVSHAVSKAGMRASLEVDPAATQSVIASRVAILLPDIAHRLPQSTIWQRDPWMNVFLAAALALTALTNSA